MTTERDWLESAKRPPEHFMARSTCTREDLFRELDYLVQDLGMADMLLRSNVARRVTRIRALASTLIPKQAKFVCDYDYGNDIKCGLEYGSASRLREHRERVHGIEAAAAA